MLELGKLLTALIAPPLNTFVLLIIAAILYRVHFKKLAKFIVLISFTWLYVMSVPLTSLSLTDNDDSPALTLDDYKQAQAIVILGGGSYPTKELYAETASGAPQLERLRYAAFLQKETGLPVLTTGYSLIGISEGDLMAKELNQFFNVPTQWIENKARNTEENASFTKTILVKNNIQKIILVTNQWHMKRAKYLFEKQGFDVLPAAAASYSSKGNLSAQSFVPDLGALNSNMVLLKEWIGYWKAHYVE